MTRMLPKMIAVPITDTDDVKSLITCLQKENLLFDNSTTETLNQTITQSIFKDLDSLISVNPAYGPLVTKLAGKKDFAEMMKIIKAELIMTNFAFVSLIMKNILTTFHYIIGDLLELFPVELQIVQLFQIQSLDLFDKVIKPYYRNQGNNIQFSDLFQIYIFIEKFISLLDKFGYQKEQVIATLKEKKLELLKLTNNSLVNEMKGKIKVITNNNCGFEIIGDTEVYQQVKFVDLSWADL
jgi:hypothetical protein